MIILNPQLLCLSDCQQADCQQEFSNCFGGFYFFHSFGAVTISDEGLHSGHCAMRTRATHTLTGDVRLKFSSAKTRDTHIQCNAFGSGAVTTCFYDLGLLQLGFKHQTFRLRSECY